MSPNTGPLVSVIIPAYNHGCYLGRALQSVVDQTYTNWEAIVIDNHSTDDTDVVLSRFSDPRIAVLKIHNNGVIAASRNMGIRVAKGEWIAFLDSDDFWTPNKLTACFACINEQVDVIYHDLEIITDQRRLFKNRSIQSWQVRIPVLIDLMTSGNVIATSSAMVRAKLLNRIDGMNENSEMVAAEDYNTWLRIAQIGNGFKYIPKHLGYYQLHNHGTSSKKDMSVPARIAAEEFIHLLNVPQRRKFEANLQYTRGRFLFLKGSASKAKHELLASLVHGRFSIKLKSALMLIRIILSR